jgi:hypothetical protein
MNKVVSNNMKVRINKVVSYIVKVSKYPAGSSATIVPQCEELLNEVVRY